MLSENGIRMIGEIIIGDIPDLYSYKTGSEIVGFFNSNFGFSDVYKSGFPSRWLYTVEKLKILWNANRFNDFLNVILSKRFVMVDNNLSEVEALSRINDIVDFINKELNS